MEPDTIAGIIVLAVGAIMALSPDSFLKFQIGVQKKVFGAEYIPSQRTARIIRSLGVGLCILGALVLTGAIT